MVTTGQDSLTVLQVASFQGNIGDNANHNGTRKKLRENLSHDIKFSESEIRKYYVNYTRDDALAFDENFVSKANSHDLVLIGGGNFFELWVEDSVTGTTIDMPIEIYDQIDSPVVFYGLGCDPHMGVPKQNYQKFRRFLEYMLNDENCLVSVRNDGSKSNIAECFGTELAEEVSVVPDGGFFLEVSETSHPELSDEKSTIGINVATDMVETRFPNHGLNELSYEGFVQRFGNVLNNVLERNTDFDFVFFPHIYSDLRAIADVLAELDTLFRRTRVTVAPLLHGFGSAEYIFDMYEACECTMGMRFHSNVPPIGLTVPSIGLSSYPQIKNLYTELGLTERAVCVNERGFEEPLQNLIFDTLDQRPGIVEEYNSVNNSLEEDLAEFHSEIQKLVASRGL